MWLIFALASALFSGTTAVLAKYGIKKVDSDLAVALRSVVILAFAWMMVLFTGSWREIGTASTSELIFPLLSGISNALSWICYFKALQMSSVNKVAPVDKAGITLTMIGGWLFLDEAMTVRKIISIVMILGGALLMVEKESIDKITEEKTKRNHSDSASAADTKSASKRWLYWAIASAIFAATTTLLSKAGVKRLNSDLGFAIRTGVMFIMTWGMIIFKGNLSKKREVGRKAALFIALSGLTTALAWLCYFRALASPHGEAGIVQPIDKLSILVSVVGARLLFKEKLKPRAAIGLAVLVAGIVILVL